MPAHASEVTLVQRANEPTWIARIRMPDGRRLDRNSRKTSNEAAWRWGMAEPNRILAQQAEERLTVEENQRQAQAVRFHWSIQCAGA